MDKTVQVRDLVIGEGRPKICIPVMGSTTRSVAPQSLHTETMEPSCVQVGSVRLVSHVWSLR